MIEKREELISVRLVAPDEEGSGIHPAVWRSPIAMVTTAAPEGWGTWGEELARRLVAELGARVLRRFSRLTVRDGAAVLEAAAERLVRSGPPSVGPIEAHVRRTVLCEAVAVDRRRFAEEVGATTEHMQKALDVARGRLSSLTGRERSVLLAVFTLDHVAEEDEVGKVVLHAAVAYQMRWNTAHQHVSRAWRKLCEGSLSKWETEWRAAHRFVCDPPSFELWAAARAYLDACSGRGAHDGPAFAAWTRAHEDHNAWFCEWKKRSALATQRWRAFVAGLDGSGLTPRDLAEPLVDACGALGIDRWLVPAKVARQSWHDLLHEAPRPSPEARAAWRALLRAHPFGAATQAAFREVERETAFAEVASVELTGAYHRLLAAAEGRSQDGVQAKEEFRRTLEAARWA